MHANQQRLFKKKKLNYKYASCGNFNIYEIQDALRQKKIERREGGNIIILNPSPNLYNF